MTTRVIYILCLAYMFVVDCLKGMLKELKPQKIMVLFSAFTLLDFDFLLLLLNFTHMWLLRDCMSLLIFLYYWNLENGRMHELSVIKPIWLMRIL